ncbi:MAG: CPBP family intramembrane metalloprotease [Deltaproteobacteria bacterium]|nr:CPBP family intramembrane metalloprotease [Deltaproteobacteria bacterium]
MTIPLAVIWSLLASAGWIAVASLTMLLRPSAATDLVNIQACMALAYLLAIFLMARVHAFQHTLADFLGIRHTHPLLYGLAACIGVSLTIPAEIIRRAIERRWHTPPEEVLDQISAFRMDTPIRHVLIPLVVIAVGPLIEELFFRGALQRGLRRVYPDATVVPLVAVLFAAAHQDARAMLPLFIVGLMLCTLRSGSGSLLPPLIAHMCFNAVGIFEMLRGQGSAETETTPLPLSWSVAGIAATAVFTAAFVLVARRSSRAQSARQEDST